MFQLFRSKLIKDPMKGIAALMYQDVSDDSWDQEHLTKENLDFSIESMRFIDQYSKRLMTTEKGAQLLDQYFENFVSRIGAYAGEVIRRHRTSDLHWYDSRSVSNYSKNYDTGFNAQSVLYAKEQDMMISPLDAVTDFLKGDSPYDSLMEYTEEMIKIYY